MKKTYVWITDVVLAYLNDKWNLLKLFPYEREEAIIERFSARKDFAHGGVSYSQKKASLPLTLSNLSSLHCKQSKSRIPGNSVGYRLDHNSSGLMSTRKSKFSTDCGIE